MIIVREVLTLAELKRMAAALFGDMVKAAVDIRREVVALDAELHADLEAELIADGSLQADIWGINVYPELAGEDFVEFDSMINMRPAQGNKSRGIESKEIREAVRAVVNKRIAR